LLQAEHEKTLALTRATIAEHEARQARDSAGQHAIELQRLEQLAHTDELTGLPNRRAFVARWEDALARSGRHHYGIGMLLIDADRFKTINDTLGHLVGDDVLVAIGASLRRAAHSEDLIARLGGDEFAMAVCHANRDDLIDKAQSIRRHFAEIVTKLGVDATLSIGIAHSDDGLRQELFGYADQALYRSKAAGGDRAMAFSGGRA
jgi:diguanylate cyclase